MTALRPIPDAPRPASPLSAAAAIARDIKLSHSVFALPFAVLAMFLSAGWRDRWTTVSEVALIVVCMVLARTVAMTVNRWADAALDGQNPRTAERAIPTGRVHPQAMLGVAIGCAFLFVVATSGFWIARGNAWPLALSPLVLAYLAGYSFTKRFTWLCHLYLGAALALSPLAATLAIEPGYLGEPTPWLIALMVTCWVAGFDIIYALQDIAFDRAQGLASIPAKFGPEGAMWISRGLHATAAAALVAAWSVGNQLGAWFGAAAAVTVGLLVLEHALVWGSRTHRIPVAFLTVNGVISLVLGAAGCIDVLSRL